MYDIVARAQGSEAVAESIHEGDVPGRSPGSDPVAPESRSVAESDSEDEGEPRLTGPLPVIEAQVPGQEEIGEASPAGAHLDGAPVSGIAGNEPEVDGGPVARVDGAVHDEIAEVEPADSSAPPPSVDVIFDAPTTAVPDTPMAQEADSGHIGGEFSSVVPSPVDTARNASRDTEPIAPVPDALAADVASADSRDAGYGYRDARADLVRERTAIATAAAVHEGARTPTEVVAEALVRMVERDRKINAFTVVRGERARREAVALEQRSDLDVLPMAGVPVAVEHSLAVAGEAVPRGSGVAGADHPVVTRLRAAGAVVTGLTGTSEFGLWPMSDDAEPLTRDPWNRVRASGAAAAAVAAGAVPVATAVDGAGAVRVGAACCGVFGIKPGRYAVPAQIGVDSWGGMAENGVLATSVADAALALSVLAARPDLADTDPPDRLRIGVAVDSPHRMLRVDRQWTGAALEAAELAAAEGHTVERVALPQGPAALAALLRWYTAELPREDLPEQPERLQPRTRRHLAVGRSVRRLRLVRPAQIDRIEARLLELFEHYDVVITPTLAAPPPRARNHGARGRLADLLAIARFTPFTPIWNLVGWPAASIPMGTHTRSRTPLAAQLAGPPGAESALLRLAAQLEARKPWRRVAP